MCIARASMPQLDLAEYDYFVQFCANQGIDVIRKPVVANALNSMQCWGPWRSHIVKPTTARKPVLVSSDYYILDGNTRWASALLSKRSAIDAVILDLRFYDAVKFMFTFPATYAYGDGELHPYSV